MKIWYDVSGLYNWRGNFTGIQRAVFNLGQSLAADDRDAHFFIFQHGGFREVSFAELEARLEELKKEKVADEHQTQKLTLSYLQHHGMIRAKQAVIGSGLEEPLRKVYGGLRTARRSFKSHQPSAVHHSIFGEQDVVVVVDGNWQFGGYAKALIDEKTKTGFRLVHFVHDIVAIKNPALANTGADKIIGTYFETIFPHADKLLAISESTKRDVEWFAKKRGLQPSISVVLLGSDIQQAGTLEPRRPAKATLPDDFILAVSTLEIRKNYLLMYYAYKQAARQNITMPHLVIVGRKGWMAEETYSLLTKDPDVRDSVTILSGVTDEELEWLYQNCAFTVFPSLYEGWGLPIAESLIHGKCCISSDTSSMPEVGGELVRYVSPYDAAGMVQAIQDLSDIKVRHKAEARIRTGYKPVTWRDTYDSFLNELTSIAV